MIGIFNLEMWKKWDFLSGFMKFRICEVGSTGQGAADKTVEASQYACGPVFRIF